MSNATTAVLNLFKAMSHDEKLEVLRELVEFKTQGAFEDPTATDVNIGDVVDTEITDKNNLWVMVVHDIDLSHGVTMKSFTGEWGWQQSDGTVTVKGKGEVKDGTRLLLGTKKSKQLIVGMRYLTGGERKGVMTEHGIKRLPKGEVIVSEANKSDAYEQLLDIWD